MKLIKADKEQFCFHIQPRERLLLSKVLGVYPLVPPAHQRLSRSKERPEADQLLNEALAVQRRENKAHVELFLSTAFRPHEGGYRFCVPPARMEWLLQVLNDVRVGSWLLLGSPASQPQAIKTLDQKTAPHFWTMEMAGVFEMFLLRALDGTDKPEPPPKA